MKKFEAVLFDWAYTLVDLGEENDRIPLNKIHDYLTSLGHSLPDFETWYRTYHDLFFSMIARSRECHLEARFEVVLHYLLFESNVQLQGEVDLKGLVRMFYEDVYTRRNVYEDTVPTLKALKKSGYPLGIVSNTTNPGFMKDFERQQTGLDSYFDFSIYSSEVPYRKPHPSIFLLASRRLQKAPQEILYVGDNLVSDVQGAHGAGMKTAWINRKMSVVPEGIQPDYTVARLTELLKILEI